ncbi:MAG: hypothetical protein WDN28_22405 [Chthoniobacter sp.]
MGVAKRREHHGGKHGRLAVVREVVQADEDRREAGGRENRRGREVEVGPAKQDPRSDGARARFQLPNEPAASDLSGDVQSGSGSQPQRGEEHRERQEEDDEREAERQRSVVEEVQARRLKTVRAGARKRSTRRAGRA